MKRALSQAAGETVVLASSEKIGAASAFLIAPVRDVATVITDHPTEHPAIDAIRAVGVQVIGVLDK